MSEIRAGLLESMYETAVTIRRFEQRAIEQYRLGNIRGYLHLYLGEEAIAVGSIAALEPDDYIVSTHRGHGHAIAKGHDPRRMMAELFGRETGYCRGRGGSMHVASRSVRNLGANGIVGGRSRDRRRRGAWRSGSGAGPRSWSRSAATARRPTGSGTRP